jgi:hypothetical protein
MLLSVSSSALGDQPGSLQGAPDGGFRHAQLMLLIQVPSDGVRTGIQPLPGQLMAQPDDQLGSSHRDRRRLTMRPPGPGLECRLTFGSVAGE